MQTAFSHPAPPRRAEPDLHSRRPLPAAPLLEALESACRRRQVSLSELLGGERSSLRRRAERIRAAGTVQLRAAEVLCDVLGVHPRELWGDLYDAQAFAGLSDDYDPWEGVA
jgi:hypothetical protein